MRSRKKLKKQKLTTILKDALAGDQVYVLNGKRRFLAEKRFKGQYVLMDQAGMFMIVTSTADLPIWIEDPDQSYEGSPPPMK